MRFESILEWYSGKAHDTIVQFTIPALVECAELGYWKKGVARTVRATLSKQNEARKFVDAKLSKESTTTRGDLLEKLEGKKRTQDQMARGFGTHESGWYLAHAMRFGSFGLAHDNLALAERLRHYAEKADRATYEAWGAAYRWCNAFLPIAELVKLLDSRRPARTVVMKTLSPTVALNISKHIGIDVSTIQTPPMHSEWVVREIKGHKVEVMEIVIDWPEGTKHCASKYGVSNAGNQQCEACGHAIRNGFNWVPILAYSEHGKRAVPYSLWVGRDCAEKLFGCEVEGDAIYKR